MQALHAEHVRANEAASQLVNSSSGIHPRFVRYYLRRVRADSNDPGLSELRTHAHNINATWADLLGIEPSKAITTVKPA